MCEGGHRLCPSQGNLNHNSLLRERPCSDRTHRTLLAVHWLRLRRRSHRSRSRLPMHQAQARRLTWLCRWPWTLLRDLHNYQVYHKFFKTCNHGHRTTTILTTCRIRMALGTGAELRTVRYHATADASNAQMNTAITKYRTAAMRRSASAIGVLRWTLLPISCGIGRRYPRSNPASLTSV